MSFIPFIKARAWRSIWINLIVNRGFVVMVAASQSSNGRVIPVFNSVRVPRPLGEKIFSTNFSSLSRRVVLLASSTASWRLWSAASGPRGLSGPLAGLTIYGIALARAIEHFLPLMVQDRLTDANCSALVASGLFLRPERDQGQYAAQPLRSSIYAFKTDFVVAIWVARVQSE